MLTLGNCNLQAPDKHGLLKVLSVQRTKDHYADTKRGLNPKSFPWPTVPWPGSASPCSSSALATLAPCGSEHTVCAHPDVLPTDPPVEKGHPISFFPQLPQKHHLPTVHFIPMAHFPLFSDLTLNDSYNLLSLLSCKIPDDRDFCSHSTSEKWLGHKTFINSNDSLTTI